MMQKKSYFNKIDSENYKNSNNVIDFNSKTQSASVDGKYNSLPDGESENYSIIDNIALTSSATLLLDIPSKGRL